MKLCKKITTLALTGAMVIGTILAPAKSTIAASPSDYHGCSHCQSIYGYAVPMQLLYTDDSHACKICGPIKSIKTFQCYTCSDKCCVSVCPNGHEMKNVG